MKKLALIMGVCAGMAFASCGGNGSEQGSDSNSADTNAIDTTSTKAGPGNDTVTNGGAGTDTIGGIH